MIAGLSGRAARRLAAVDALVVPAAVQQRLRQRYPGLDRAGPAIAEAAARRWFRLVAQRPRATLAMPSRLVDDLWTELAKDERAYGEFCGAAFGRPIPHTPLTDPTAAALALHRSEGLLATLRWARQDEGTAAGGVPLLFRADRDAGLANYRYVGDCGARGDCHVRPDEVCLHHLGGIERWARRGSAPADRRHEYGSAGSADSGGGDGGGH
jgi:hypothetical protein